MDPVERKHIRQMKELAKRCQREFAGYGFTILVFDLERRGDGRMNYMSNAKRDGMIEAMEEFIAHHRPKH